MRKIASLLLTLALLGGCGQQGRPPSSQGDTLRMGIDVDPQTLDPRLARTLNDSIIIQMIYEGLMRVSSLGHLENALAEQIVISDDHKTYEIHLKPSRWSDGTPLVAADFVDTWKSMLDPAFPSANASQLYVIKGAKQAKEGIAALDSIGLKTVSDSIFIVELEEPTAYFKKLLATHFFLPLPPSLRQQAHAQSDSQINIYNGPFALTEWKRHDRMVFAKNGNYWDKKHVKLKEIIFQVADGITALNLFQQNELDWAGSPLSTLPQDAIPTLMKQKTLGTTSANGTYWFRFNTAVAPFTNVNMRKAFNLALNRTEIVQHILQGNQQIALGILPPALFVHKGGYYKDNQIVSAWEHFQAALLELGISKDDLPPITLAYSGNERHNKLAQAVQQQWQSALGIPISLQAYEPKVSYQKLAKGEYQIMLGSWFADFEDPINFLDVFKSKNNGTNNTGWENATYALLLEESNRELDTAKRQALLQQAEAILMDNVPVAPLFYNTYNYVKKQHVSVIGMDFKNAYIHDYFEDPSRD